MYEKAEVNSYVYSTDSKGLLYLVVLVGFSAIFVQLLQQHRSSSWTGKSQCQILNVNSMPSPLQALHEAFFKMPSSPLGQRHRTIFKNWSCVTRIKLGKLKRPLTILFHYSEQNKNNFPNYRLWQILTNWGKFSRWRTNMDKICMFQKIKWSISYQEDTSIKPLVHLLDSSLKWSCVPANSVLHTEMLAYFHLILSIQSTIMRIVCILNFLCPMHSQFASVGLYCLGWYWWGWLFSFWT